MAVTQKEDSIIDKDDFLETQEIIRKQIQSNSKLTGAQKRQCLQVLEGIGHSVIYGGVRQHGITKAMLKTAFPVFGKMSEDNRHNDKEPKVLKVLTYLIYQGIIQ